MAEKRADRVGTNRTAFEKNARYIYKTQEVCGICGLPVDKTLKSPDPMSKTIDHIIPVSRGGHPFELANLQLAHRCCNRQKGARLFIPGYPTTPGLQNNPGTLNDPGDQNSPGSLNNPPGLTEGPGLKPMAIQNTPSGKPRVDNDNLPQHADWSEFKW